MTTDGATGSLFNFDSAEVRPLTTAGVREEAYATLISRYAIVHPRPID